MGYRIRTTVEFSCYYGIQRNHRTRRSGLRPNIYVADIIRIRAIFRRSLCLYPENTAKFNEVINIQITKQGLHGIENFRNRYTQRLGSFTVYVSVHSGRADAKVRAGNTNSRMLHGLAHKCLCCLGKFRKISSSWILQLDRETTGCAQPAN